MPVERHPVSTLELAESLGVDPKRFISLHRDMGERGVRKPDRTKWWIVLQPEEQMTQTTGTFPQNAKGPKKGGKKK